MYVNVNLMVGILIRITANADVTVKIWNNIMYTKKKKKQKKEKKRNRFGILLNVFVKMANI